MAWEITKQFDFDYGHRVWSQTLNEDLALDNKCVCRHLHGHRGRVLVTLKGEDLKDGMVTDFKHLNWLKKFIDDVIDHKFIMDLKDPLLPTVYPLAAQEDALYYRKGRYWEIREDSLPPGAPLLKELYEGVIFVEFVPTSENLSKWLFDLIQYKMRGQLSIMDRESVTVHKVQFFETPKSESTYYK